MLIKESIEIKAKPCQVFNMYQAVACWRDWDPEVADANLPDGLILEAKGWLKPRSGPKANIQVIEVTENQSFTIQSKLPLCRMLFKHSLTEIDGGTMATHWVEFSGPLSFLFRYLIGKSIQVSLPNTMYGLKQASEAKVD